MSLVRSFITATLAAGALIACTAPTDGTKTPQPVIKALPRALSGDEQVAATATTEFGLALFKSVNARTGRDSNLALSPISASLALGMLMNGAEGETLDQVRRTLGFGARQVADVNGAYKALLPLLTALDPSVKMTFANAAWFDLSTPPSTTFTASLGASFDARVSSLPFNAPSTVTTINDWVSKATNARIPKILNELDAGARALLVNATYFKGSWRAQFDAQQTRTAPFRVSPSATMQAAMMNTESGLVRVGYAAGGTVIGELPYGGDAFVMDIVMPPLGTLEPFIDSLTPATWSTLLAALPAEAREQPVTLPKFRLETTRKLQESLSQLGMPRVFGAAQLAPMFATPVGATSVSDVVQRVFVDVNEEGTEAAAVTSVVVVVTSATGRFTVDQPFLFAIRDRLTGTILFIGKVIRPVAPVAP